MVGQVLVVSPEGALGRDLVESLIARGRAPLLLVDNPSEVPEQFPGAAGAVRFNGLTVGPWVDAFDGAGVVFSFAGAIAREGEAPHLLAQRRRMAGRLMEDAVSSVRVAPRVLVGLSSVRALMHETPPKHPTATALDEQTPTAQNEAARALGDLERGILSTRQRGTRAVVVRLGLVIDPRDGFLPAYQRRFQAHLGGAVRPKMGLWPWLHVEDALGLLHFAADPEHRLEGLLNAVAPVPTSSGQLAVEIGLRMGRVPWLPIMRGAARRYLGADTVSLLTRGPPIASRAGGLGYTFAHPTIGSALDAALGAPARRRESRRVEEAHQA